jgi:alanine racemase
MAVLGPVGTAGTTSVAQRPGSLCRREHAPRAGRLRRPRETTAVHRSQITIDLRALRRNVRMLLGKLEGAEVWAVVKANGYGHGAADIARAALDAGSSALCVATVAEALSLRDEFREARIIVLGPAVAPAEIALAREAGLELAVSGGEIPQGVRVHLKLETGMGRYGLSELPRPGENVVGLMTHLATADTDEAFAKQQLERFVAATAEFAHLTRHVANSAAALRLPAARLDAARCGIALYGLSPFGTDPAVDGLEPVLAWSSHVAQTKLLRPGESTGYGRRFVAERVTWIALVPVGYADGFRRDMTGTEVRVGDELCRVVGTVSMDSFAVELDRELPAGTPVVLVGDGVLVESHARVAGTINYEVVCGIEADPRRAQRAVVDG